MNASTFTARVIASTLSDMHSAITGAIGALKGPLHGGANEQVMQLLQAIAADASVDDEIRARLDRKERIMGFGHRVYKTWDPRAVILKRFSKSLARRPATRTGTTCPSRSSTRWSAEKGLYPNVDFYSASTYHYLGHRHRAVHADLRHEPGGRLGRARDRAARRQPADPAELGVRRPGGARLRADRAPRGAAGRRDSVSPSGRSRMESPRPGLNPTGRYARTAATLRGSTSRMTSRRPSRSNA